MLRSLITKITGTTTISADRLHHEIAGKFNCSTPPAVNALDALKEYELKYPADEQWRLLVDGVLYSQLSDNEGATRINLSPDPNGWKEYAEREPGCIANFFAAWQYCLDQIKQHPEHTDLTIDFIKHLHRLAMRHDKNPLRSNLIGRFRNITIPTCSFGLCGKTFYRYTHEGLENLLTSIATGELPGAKLLLIENPIEGLEIHEQSGTSCNKQTRKAGAYLVSPNSNGYRISFIVGKPENDSIFHIAKQLANQRSTPFAFAMEDNKVMDITIVDATFLQNKSKEQLHELIDLIRDKILDTRVCLLTASDPAYCSEQFVTDSVQSILDTFNNEIRNHHSVNETLACIGKTIEKLERTHPFCDGNGRVFVNLLLNYLLIKSGFPPATFFDPNVFDAYGHTVNVIKRGIYNTLQIYAGKKDLFGYSNCNQDLTTQMREFMAEGKSMFLQDQCAGFDTVKEAYANIGFFTPATVTTPSPAQHAHSCRLK